MLRGKKYPVVGRISMDQVVVNIEWDSAYNDDEVLLIGEMDGEEITVPGPGGLGGHHPVRDPDQYQYAGSEGVCGTKRGSSIEE